MRDAVNAAVADVQKRFDDKELPWNYKTVMGKIIAYPNKNCLDTLLVGQDDEATVDPDKHKWDEDGDASIMGAADESDDELMDFDSKDWVRGEEARVTHAVAADTDAQHHGHGGAVLENLALAIVDDEEVDLAFKQNQFMRQLKVADGVFKGMEGAVGASLRNTVAAVINEEKTFRLTCEERQ